MESKGGNNYKALSNLKLYDLKAQKKTVALKKFCNLPLTEVEELKDNFEHLSIQPSQSIAFFQMGKTVPAFRLRRKLNRLSQPKLQGGEKQGKNQEIEKIMKKCKREMSTGFRFHTQMDKFERVSDQCLSSIEQKMKILISDGLTANYYLWPMLSQGS